MDQRGFAKPAKSPVRDMPEPVVRRQVEGRGQVIHDRGPSRRPLQHKPEDFGHYDIQFHSVTGAMIIKDDLTVPAAPALRVVVTDLPRALRESFGWGSSHICKSNRDAGKPAAARLNAAAAHVERFQNVLQAERVGEHHALHQLDNPFRRKAICFLAEFLRVEPRCRAVREDRRGPA